MSELADIIEANIEKFDALREVFASEDSSCHLLVKKDLQTSDYRIVKTLSGGYYFKFSPFYNFFNLKYATLEDGFLDVSNIVTHIALDTVVYYIPPEQRVVIKPNGAKPYYQFLCLETKPMEIFIPE